MEKQLLLGTSEGSAQGCSYAPPGQARVTSWEELGRGKDGAGPVHGSHNPCCVTPIPGQLLPEQGLKDLLMHKTQQGVTPLLLQALGHFRLSRRLRTQTKQSYTYDLFYCILFA